MITRRIALDLHESENELAIWKAGFSGPTPQPGPGPRGESGGSSGGPQSSLNEARPALVLYKTKATRAVQNAFTTTGENENSGDLTKAPSFGMWR